MGGWLLALEPLVPHAPQSSASTRHRNALVSLQGEVLYSATFLHPLLHFPPRISTTAYHASLSLLPQGCLWGAGLYVSASFVNQVERK